MTSRNQEKSVQQYFDYDAGKYSAERYPQDARTCDQYSYLTRKDLVLRLLDSGGTVGRVLDVGCGPGIYVRELLERGWRVAGIDLSPGMVERAKAIAGKLDHGDRAEFSVGVVTDLKFADAQFDAILCIGVISYVEDLPRALAEIVRVLRPGGRAIVQVSNRVSPFERYVHVKRRLTPVWQLMRKPDQDDQLRQKIRLRAYRIPDFERQCLRHGLRTVAWSYFDFRLPILDRLSPAWALGLGKKMQSWGHSRWLGWLGASYVVAMEKASTE